MLTEEQIVSDGNASSHKVRCLTRLLVVALPILSCTFSAPAMACLCSCSIFSTPADDTTATQATPAEYDQVFSGLVVSTERTSEPVGAPEVLNEKLVVDSGYWVKSKVLVLRIWQGAPSTVAEVWTPVSSNCDVRPIAGFYFVALVQTEEGRSVAHNTHCDCAAKAAATEGPARFSMPGVVLIATAVGVATSALFLTVKAIRRRRPSR